MALGFRVPRDFKTPELKNVHGSRILFIVQSLMIRGFGGSGCICARRCQKDPASRQRPKINCRMISADAVNAAGNYRCGLHGPELVLCCGLRASELLRARLHQ